MTAGTRARAAMVAELSVALIAIASLVACDAAARRESAALGRAVDAYRQAPASAKAERGKAVGAVECSEAKVCEARDACVAAIDPTTRALALRDEVAARIGDIEKGKLAPDSPDAHALPAKLDEAERLLQEGRGKMADCDRKLVDLKADYGG
jgi:hypothetical protein